MSTSFPTGLDTLTNPTATDKVAVVSHASQHANANDAIEALQAKVGANSSAVTTSHDYKLGEVTGADKAVGKTATQTLTNKTLTSPTINNAVMTTPTGITATDVGLGSVTNDAQLKRAEGDLNTFTQKVAPEAADILVIEDSSASYAKKKVLASAFGVGQPGQFLKNFTSRTALTLGQPVGISNLIDSYVSPSILSVSSASHGISSQTIITQTSFASCAIGGDKFVYLLADTSASDTLYAQVGSVDTTTNTLTLGTAATVATAVTPNISSGLTRCATISKLDTDKFIVIYVKDSSATTVLYRVGTISGTTITFGTEATFLSTGSSVATSNGFRSEFISTDKGVAIIHTNTTTDCKIVAFTVSGTVATVGTGVTPGAVGTLNLGDAVIRKIGTDKFVLASLNGTSVYTQVGTISGTTITLGSEVTTSVTSIGSAELTVVSPTTDVFVTCNGLTGNANVNLIAFTVSGTVPTAGTPLTVASATSTSLLNKDTTTLYVFDGTSKNVKTVTRSGNTLTLGTTACNEFTSSQFETAIVIDNGYPITLEVSATTTSCWIYGMSNNFIGFAQSSVSALTQVAVAYTGIDTNQTGLTAGTAYLPTGGALVITDNIFTTNTIKAISATEVIF